MILSVIGAMDSELKGLSELINVEKTETVSGMEFIEGTLNDIKIICCKSNVGKVNAAMCAQTLIIKYHPDLILNLGVVGGINSQVKTGDIIIASDAVQHDFDVSADSEYKKGQICNIDILKIPCDKSSSEKLFKISEEAVGKGHVFSGTVATGDQFINSDKLADSISQEFNALCVDMEFGSIAQTAYLNNIPFAAVKSVSDSGGDNAFESFENFLEFSAQRAVEIVKNYIFYGK